MPATRGHANRHQHAGADRPAAGTFERTIEVEAHIRRIQELIEKALSLSTGLSEDCAASS